MQSERRDIDSGITVVRRGSTKAIVGYAAKFDSLSSDLGGFREIIKPGAFDRAIRNADIRFLVNHNKNLVLGRTTAGTLKLYADKIGLRYEVIPPDTEIARHYLTAVERRDITGGSFWFFMDDDKRVGQSWSGGGSQSVIRTITQFREIKEVSLVTWPAYPDTEAAVRHLEEYKRTAMPKGLDLKRKRLELERMR